MKRLGAILLLFGLGVAVVLGVRTAQNRPAQPVAEIVPRPDANEAATRLAELIRYRTVSDASEYDASEFEGLVGFLRRAYPRVHENLTVERVGRHGLLYTWTGTNPELRPVLFAAHTDVVPASNAEQWTHPPFEGAIADGYVWGRGAMDDKSAVIGLLEATDALLDEGFQPERTVYFAFGHDEELDGADGAAQIAALLAERGVELEAVLDEGLVVTHGIVDLVEEPVALIGVAEKGDVSVEIAAKDTGGHSSMPPSQTAVGRVARAVHRLEAHPFDASVRGGPAEAFLGHLGPHAGVLSVVLANLWLFDPLVTRILTEKPSTNALLRSTVAPTMLKGSPKQNVLATEASAVVNVRIDPRDSVDRVLERFREVIDDDQVTVTPLPGASEPSSVSSHESRAYQAIAESIAATFPDALVVPGLVMASTDARHYESLAEDSYRFVPIEVTETDTVRIHGRDERISVQGLGAAIAFYKTALERLSGPTQ